MGSPVFLKGINTFNKSLLNSLVFSLKTNSLFRYGSTMKAVVMEEYGEPDVLKVKEIEKPVPGKSEVLVKVKASGINPVDVLIREGAFMSLPNLPLILGKEVAGVVEEVGEDVKHFKGGERVTCCLPGNGGYAEYVTCDENRLISLPYSISPAQSCCLYVSYFAAIRALITKAKIKKGQILLVHGASGGVGVAAVQIAKSKGLTVIGTAGSKPGEKVVERAGADLVFNHNQEGYLADVYSASDSKGFDVILENYADFNLGDDLMMIKKSGQIVIVGTKSSSKSKIGRPQQVEINPRSLIFTEGSILAANLMQVSPDEFKQYSDLIVHGIEESWLRPIVGYEFKLGQAADAHRRLRESPSVGKLVFNLEL